MLDCVRYLARMWPGNLGHRVGLTHNEEVLDLPNVVPRFALYRIPIGYHETMVSRDLILDLLDHQEVCTIRFMPE